MVVFVSFFVAVPPRNARCNHPPRNASTAILLATTAHHWEALITSFLNLNATSETQRIPKGPSRAPGVELLESTRTSELYGTGIPRAAHLLR